MSEKVQVLFDSPEAATRKTVTGWVSRDGRYCGDGPAGERHARYAGCTHVKCEDCGAIIGKGWTRCSRCRDGREFAQWDAAPKEPMGDDSMVFSRSQNEYYQDKDHLIETVTDLVNDEVYDTRDEALRNMRLYHCSPCFGKQLDSSWFEDELAEDEELPEELCAVIDAFNAAVKAFGQLSYAADYKRAVDVEALIVELNVRQESK